jgi:hypothetical protein
MHRRLQEEGIYRADVGLDISTYQEEPFLMYYTFLHVCNTLTDDQRLLFKLARRLLLLI